MILKEHHKEFAIKAFAKFMTRKQVVNAFIQEFPNDLPKPPQPPQIENPNTSKEGLETEKEQFINSYLHDKIYSQYKDKYGDKADEQWEKDLSSLKDEVEKVYDQTFPEGTEAQQKKQMWEYQDQLKNYQKQLKIDLSNQLRRYNITHPKFPKKYRSLFHKFRQEHYQNFYHNETKQTPDTINKELNILYGVAKEQVFLAQEAQHVIKHLDIAHNLLKTIVAYNTLTPSNHQGSIETNPEPPKQLTE